MSMDITVFHSYGLLFSKESISIILSHMLPVWEKERPELYKRFSTEDPYIDFCEYLNTHYEVNIYGNVEHLRCYRLCDQEGYFYKAGDFFYLLDLNSSPSLFESAYSDFDEIIQEVKMRIGELMPPDFPYEEYLLEILGETWG